MKSEKQTNWPSLQEAAELMVAAAECFPMLDKLLKLGQQVDSSAEMKMVESHRVALELLFPGVILLKQTHMQSPKRNAIHTILCTESHLHTLHLVTELRRTSKGLTWFTTVSLRSDVCPEYIKLEAPAKALRIPQTERRPGVPLNQARLWQAHTVGMVLLFPGVELDSAFHELNVITSFDTVTFETEPNCPSEKHPEKFDDWSTTVYASFTL